MGNAIEKPKFNPNKPFTPLESKDDSVVTLKGLKMGALESLPMVGAIGGGLIGTSVGPGGTLLGAGLGGAAGGSLKSFIEGLSTPKTYGDVLKAPVSGAIEGLSGEMGGQVLGKAIGKIPTILQKANAPEIMAAAERLGVKATPGMTTEGTVIPGLESSLAQNPTPAGFLLRSKIEPVKKAIRGGVEGLLKDASSLSRFEAGSQIKSNLLQDISEKHAPIAQVYDDIASATKNMTLNPLGQARIAKNIRGIAEANLIPGSVEQKIAEEFASGIENIKTVDQIKLLNTRAKEMMRDPTVGGAQKQVVAQVVDKLTKYQNNSITRNAIEAARTSGEGKNIAHDIVGDLKNAGAQYRAMIEQLQKLGKGSKITTGKFGAANITREIDEVPAEKIPDMLFRTENNDFLNFVKEDYPAIYQTAREQKLSDIMKKSMDAHGDISPNKFMQSIKNLGPEVKEHLFGDPQRLSDVKTLVESIPGKVGASDTPRGLSFLDVINPLFQGKEIGRLGLFKGLQSLEPIKQKLGNPAARYLFRSTINKSMQNGEGK